MMQAAVVIGGFAIAVVMWRIAAVLEPVNAEPVPETKRGRWWSLMWVSAASAVSAATMAQVMPARPAATGFVILAAVAPGLAWIDVRSMLLPFPILTVLSLAALAAFSVDAWWSGSAGSLARAAFSGLVVAVLGWLWWKVAGDGVGLGDAALLGVAGLYLGWFSVAAVWVGLAIACLLALITVALGRIGRGRRPAGSLVPLGPPILAGWWAATALVATGWM
jgi:leader peptidase (prepilin peptidase) / N-methyltransferase